MLHTHFPQSLRRSVVQQLETNGGLKLVKLDTQTRVRSEVKAWGPSVPRSRRPHLSGSDLNVEVVPFVGDLQDLWPGEPVDPQPVSVDQQAAAAHAQHDGHALRVLRTAQCHAPPARHSPTPCPPEPAQQHGPSSSGPAAGSCFNWTFLGQSGVM